jgi:hypothetical protein
MNEITTIDTPGARFDIRVIASGEIEIYAADGMIEVTPKSNNVITLRCVPMWDDGTAIKIVKHMIAEGAKDLDITTATKIVDTLRGRVNVNKRQQ